MITRKDQTILLERISFIEHLIDTNEETIMAHYNVSKDEAIRNDIKDLMRVVEGLR